MSSQNICNICGANYEYRNGRWVCPACGAYKVEELSNEEVTLLYNAAQKLRFSDFDEAEKAYSDIVEKYPKNPDGYWGRLLSKYGIKYEEDFDGRKIPTCYATSIESVISDKDYLKAIELADADTKAYYQKQAEYIERVRKEWVEKAKKEKPYDIFICYKDSDLANGIDRTQDSIAAQELYIHLTEQGYRVFFSRESLRDKVGEKYEPYIFNALSTAKVMLVYGSKPEYITSMWLKNEWTRYEKRVQAGEKKPNSLIVACDGFSPSELPKALSSMQCFDATKRSFYSDLDAVVKRIIKGEEKPKPVAAPEKKKSKKAPIIIAAASVLIAVMLCILVPNLLNNSTTTTLTDSKHGVVITASDKVFDKNSALIVDKLSDGVQFRSLVSAVNSSESVDLQNAIIYDIECGTDIADNVTVKVPYTKSSADSTIKVFYVSDDKTLIEEHSCIYNQGFVEFETNHLSYYVIGEIAKDNGGTSTTIERVGVRTMTLSDKFTAEYVLAKWEGGSKSETSLIEIMDEYGAQQGGGKLYVITPGEFIEEIDQWCFSSERKVGDYAIIEHAYGYSLCYISSINPTQNSDDNTGDNTGDNTTPSNPGITIKDGVLQVGVCANYEPYEYLDNGELKGIEIDILKAISEELGLTIEFKNQAFEDMYSNLLQQNIDCVIGMMETAERNEFCDASIAMFSESDIDYIIYSKKECDDLQVAINAAISNLKNNGTIAQIIDNYKKPVVIKSAIINFNSNGGNGSMSAQSIVVGESANLTTCSFTKNGYTFSGWATTATGSVVYTDGASFSAESESEITLYAIWVPNSNSLIFNANGGSGSMESISITTNETIALPFNNFSKDGYTFLGWSDSQNGGVKYTDRQSFTMTSSATVTLYAVWSANTNTINFDANGGTGSMSAQQAKTDEKVTLKQNSLSRKGYTFKGWSITSDGVVAYADKAEYTMGTNASVTLYAVWEANSNKIVFNANGGSGSMNDQVILTGSKANLSACTFTREGLTFAGWATTSTGSAVYADAASYTMGEESSYTLYAVWIKAAYTITYHMNNGSNSLSNPAGYDVNSETIVFADPTRDGYTFLGWYTDATFKNKITSIPKGSIGNKTVYASWSANTNTINFNSNGGSGSMTAQQAKTDEKVTLKQNSLIRTGYTFKGWSTSASGTVVYADEAEYTMGSNASVTLYAVWEANTNTVYTVKHYLENANDSRYTLTDTETLYGTTDSSVSPNPKTYTGFNSPSKASVKILPDGSAVLEYHYTRTTYTITFETNGGSSVNSLTVKYQQVVTIPNTTRQGLTFGGWYTDVALTNEFEGSTSSNVTLYAWWAEETKPSEFNYSASGSNYTITKYIGNSTAVCVPAYIGGTPVTSIGANAFNNDQGHSVKTLVIQEGITSIGYYAFGYCGIKSVQLPSTLTSIGSYAFFHCQDLEAVTIPGSVESIGTYAFEQCTNLATAIISDGVKSIEANAFASCGKLANISLPNSLTTIGEAAFSYSGVESITIPQNLILLGNKAFEGCSKLNEVNFNATAMSDLYASNAVFAYTGTATDGISVTIGSNVTKIPSYLFYPGATSYPNITSLTFEGTSVCESIGTYAFAESMGLDTLEIPNSVTIIADFAFYCTQQYSGDRSGIKTLVLGEGVKTIGNNSFGGLSYLTSLTINSVALDDFSNSNLVFNKAGISGTGVEVIFGNKVERVPAYIFGSGTYHYHPKIVSISFASGSKCSTIEERAFYGATDLVNVDIPESISSIGELAFYNCYRLESVRITNIKKWCEITFHSDSCVLENANTKLLLNGSLVADLKNYSEITTIADYAFKGYDYFVDLTIPSNTTTVGKASFAYCQAVTKLTLPGKLTTIGENAFLSMLYLSSVTIPNSVEVIEAQGFASCGLTTVIFENGSKLTTIGESAFTGNKLDSITIPASVTTIDDYAFAYNTSLGQIRCEVVQKPAGWSTYWNANKIMTEMYAGYYDVVWF